MKREFLKFIATFSGAASFFCMMVAIWVNKTEGELIENLWMTALLLAFVAISMFPILADMDE